MAKLIRTIDELIRAFGGEEALARFFGIGGATAVSNWRARGFIPPGWHLRIFIECTRRGWRISPDLYELPLEEAVVFSMIAEAALAARRSPVHAAARA